MSIVIRAEKILLFLILLFLPTQLGKHFWPDFSYIYSLKIDYLSPTLYFWDLLIVGLMICWIIKGPKVNEKALGVGLTFFLGQSLSLIYAGNLMAGLVRLEQYFVAFLLGVYLSSKKFNEIKDILLWGLMGSVFLVSMVALGEFFLERSLGFWILGERSFNLSTPSIATFNFYGDVYLRPYSTLPHPNVLAGFLVVMLALIGGITRHSFGGGGNKRIWVVRVVALALGAIASILSFSRVGILVLLVEGFLVLRKSLRLLALLILIPLPFLYARFSSIFNFDSLSFIRREELAEFSLNQFISHPIVGIGLNNFINAIALSSLVSGPSRFLQPVHNIFLLSLVETGILGALGFLVLLGYPIFKLWKERQERYAKNLLFCFGAIIFLGMFDHYFLTLVQGQRVLFFVWGLSMMQTFKD